MRLLVVAAALLVPVSLPVTVNADVLAERPGASSVAAGPQSGSWLDAALPGTVSGPCCVKADAAGFILAKGGGAAGYGGSGSSSGGKGSGSSKNGAAGYQSTGEGGFHSGAGSNTGNFLNRSTPNAARNQKSSPPGPTETPPAVGEGHGD